MPFTRTEKETLISTYESGFSVAPHAFLVGFSGVTVPQITDLRQRIRDGGAHYAVVKNRLALRAVKGTAMEVLAEHFTGPTAVAYSQEDAVALAKVLTDFAKETPAIEFKAGLVEGKLVQAEEIRSIASLPSREQLIAKLLFLLLSPVSRFVQGLNAIQQQLVVVLDQIARKKEA